MTASPARQAGVPPNPNQKPEDKDSPEYKKKVALQTLPILCEGSLEAVHGRALRIVDDGFTEGNGIVEALQDAKQKASSPPSARQAGVPPNPNQKPEDKDSPEYKLSMGVRCG
jgi:hypothetical protein